MKRPNTLDEWLPDARNWAESKWADKLSDLEWDRLHDMFTTRLVKRWGIFDPNRSRAFTFLCMLWKNAYGDFVHWKYRPNGELRSHKDMLDIPRTGDNTTLVSLEQMKDDYYGEGRALEELPRKARRRGRRATHSDLVHPEDDNNNSRSDNNY